MKRPTNPQRTPWEIVWNLPTGTRHFAVFDALKGYHQILLAEESPNLTVFNKPFGNYRYCRLAVGTNSAQDVFTLWYSNAINKARDAILATEGTHTTSRINHPGVDWQHSQVFRSMSTEWHHPQNEENPVGQRSSLTQLVTNLILLSIRESQNFQSQPTRGQFRKAKS